MKLIYKILIVLGVSLLTFLLGFVVGKKSIKSPEPIVKIQTKYIKGETITQPVFIDKPLLIPVDTIDLLTRCIKDGVYSELFPDRVDTVYTIPGDSLAMLNDWANIRHYEQLLWNTDTTGRCSVDLDIQYNRLTNLNYYHTPVIKTETKETIFVSNKRMIEPFIGIGVNTNNSVKLMGGTFFQEHYGVALEYQKLFDTKQNVFGITAVYKF